jgi:TatD DNase family protein
MLDSDAGDALVRSLPVDRILTETDAPFTETQGRKSQPADVVETAQRLAVLCGVPVLEMRDVLTTNAARVFAFAGIDTLFESA